MDSIINRYNDIASIHKKIIDSGEISLSVSVNDITTKDLLISMASYFESSVLESIEKFYRSITSSEDAFEFVSKFALKRNFYKLFDFKTSNANCFFGFFGDGFKSYMKEIIDNQPHLRQSIADFMHICSTRNKLVHDNYSTAYIEDTTEDLISKFKSACLFSEKIEDHLKSFFCSKKESSN